MRPARNFAEKISKLHLIGHGQGKLNTVSDHVSFSRHNTKRGKKNNTTRLRVNESSTQKANLTRHNEMKDREEHLRRPLICSLDGPINTLVDLLTCNICTLNKDDVTILYQSNICCAEYFYTIQIHYISSGTRNLSNSFSLPK